jgi:hypothetical protein
MPTANARTGKGKFTMDYPLVELRGLEPLTPTLPGARSRPDQAVYQDFRAVGGGVVGAAVVAVVVKIVVSGAAVGEFGRHTHYSEAASDPPSSAS